VPPIRLQKYLADAGVASRRAGEKLIASGAVAVNGRVVTELGTRVDPAKDSVSVEGRVVRPRKKLYVALHKPRGYICTRQDPESRRIIFELLPAEWANLVPVGRLDRESEGLLFLTNDGDFCLRMTHPRYGVRKQYRAVVEGFLTPAQIGPFTRGVEHEGETLKAERVRLVSANHSHSLVELELAQGRNREVRRLFEALGYEVVELCRTQIGPIKLGELPSGKWRMLSPAEIKALVPSTVPADS
jgi:23S rRNA pseudouridine2605 synthase